MKLCLLLLSVLTLLQLHCGFAAENVWLPNLQKLSSIIHICEHILRLERNHQLPIGLRIKDKKPENININSRISLNSDKSNGPSVKSNLNVKVNKNAVSVLHSVGVDKSQDISSIPLIQSRRRGGGGRNKRPGNKIPGIRFGRPEIEVPINIFGNNNQMRRRSPPVSPLSNVVTVNNANKQDDALRGLGFRSQAADDISPRHMVAKLPFRRISVQKAKYKDIAQCVKLRLVKAYEEAMTFYD